MKLKAPLVIFNDINQKKVPTQDINNVEPNTKYKFEFDINSKTAFEKEDIYEIEICERNIYDDILITHKIEFGNFEGIKEIEFETSKYTYKFLIRFNSKKILAQRGLTINEMRINGKEHAVNYKYLPIRLVDKIQDIKLDTISVRGRLSYIEDSVKLISKYGLLGIGADGWRDRRVEVQSYYDITAEPHSYLLEVFCEFGIIGFLALALIFIILIKNLRQNGKWNYIALALITLFIHSLIDFNLSFMYMLVFFFVMLGTINNEEKEYKILDILTKILLIVLLVISMYFAVELTIDKTKYSQEYIFNQMIETGNIEENLDKMVSRRKYVSHINEINELLEKEDLTNDEYLKIYNLLKDEEYLLNKNVYAKIKEIETYQRLLKNVDTKESIIREIDNVRNMLKEPEKYRLTFEEIEAYTKKLYEIEEEVLK